MLSHDSLNILADHIHTHYLKQDLILEASTRFNCARPYRHIVLQNFLKQEKAEALQFAVSRQQSWERKTTSWYSQDSTSLNATTLSSDPVVKDFQRLILGDTFCRWVSHMVDDHNLERPEAVLHRLRGGDRIEVHNDYIPVDGERLRCLLHLGSSDSEQDGGQFVIYKDEDGQNPIQYVPPAYNSLLIFAIGPTSYHAVTPVKSGPRFTAVVSFYHRQQSIQPGY